LHVDAKSRDLTHSSTHVIPVTSAYTSVVYTRAQSIRVRVRLTRITRNYIICTKTKRGCAREENVFSFSISCSLAFFSFFFSLRSYSRLFLSVLIPESAYASCTSCRVMKEREKERDGQCVYQFINSLYRRFWQFPARRRRGRFVRFGFCKNILTCIVSVTHTTAIIFHTNDVIKIIGSQFLNSLRVRTIM